MGGENTAVSPLPPNSRPCSKPNDGIESGEASSRESKPMSGHERTLPSPRSGRRDSLSRHQLPSRRRDGASPLRPERSTSSPSPTDRLKENSRPTRLGKEKGPSAALEVLPRGQRFSPFGERRRRSPSYRQGRRRSSPALASPMRLRDRSSPRRVRRSPLPRRERRSSSSGRLRRSLPRRREQRDSPLRQESDNLSPRRLRDSPSPRRPTDSLSPRRGRRSVSPRRQRRSALKRRQRLSPSPRRQRSVSSPRRQGVSQPLRRQRRPPSSQRPAESVTEQGKRSDGAAIGREDRESVRPSADGLRAGQEILSFTKGKWDAPPHKQERRISLEARRRPSRSPHSREASGSQRATAVTKANDDDEVFAQRKRDDLQDRRKGRSPDGSLERSPSKGDERGISSRRRYRSSSSEHERSDPSRKRKRASPPPRAHPERSFNGRERDVTKSHRDAEPPKEGRSFTARKSSPLRRRSSSSRDVVETQIRSFGHPGEKNPSSHSSERRSRSPPMGNRWTESVTRVEGRTDSRRSPQGRTSRARSRSQSYTLAEHRRSVSPRQHDGKRSYPSKSDTDNSGTAAGDQKRHRKQQYKKSDSAESSSSVSPPHLASRKGQVRERRQAEDEYRDKARDEDTTIGRDERHSHDRVRDGAVHGRAHGGRYGQSERSRYHESGSESDVSLDRRRDRGAFRDEPRSRHGGRDAGGYRGIDSERYAPPRHRKDQSFLKEDTESVERDRKNVSGVRKKPKIEEVLKDETRVEKSKEEEGEGVTGEKPKPSLADLNPVGRTGGVYIPPFKLARFRKEITDKTSVEYQKQFWEALRKSVNGYVNKANLDNIPNLVEEMFRENLIRGRGLLARAILRAQLASPTFTHVFAGLLAVLNSKLPEVGRLLITRLVLQFRRAYKRNDKIVITACLKFMAHLINQRVLNEIVGLELCALLLEKPTNDGVEVCCSFLAEAGQALQNLQSQAVGLIFDRLRAILNEGEVDMRTQYTIEKLFDIRRKKFAELPAVVPQLDLIEEDDQVTHSVDLLDGDLSKAEMLDIFKALPPEQFASEEAKWKEISDDILGKNDSDREGGSDSDDGSSVDSEVEAEQRKEELNHQTKIMDCSEQDLINLRKTVYLCIMSSASFEECVHKLLKLNIPEGQEIEVCIMLIDCCSMERTFSTFFALQGERLCRLKESFRNAFLDCFRRQYAQIHRLETNKLRNIAKFFAHLFATDALPWTAFEIFVLTDQATTAASRIFIKIVFQDLADELGLQKLQEKLSDPELQPCLEKSLFPKDNVANIRFSINFFTAIGLGALADHLRAFLTRTTGSLTADANGRTSSGCQAKGFTSRTSPCGCEVRCRTVCTKVRRCRLSSAEEESSSSELSDSGSISISESESESSLSVSASESMSESSSSEASEYEEKCRRRCRVVCETVCKEGCSQRKEVSSEGCSRRKEVSSIGKASASGASACRRGAVSSRTVTQ